VAVGKGTGRAYLVAFFLLVIAIVTPVLVRIALHPQGPAVEIISSDGHRQTITLSQMKRLPVLKRKGAYQNQFGNWRDEGVYSGVRLTDLIGSDANYAAICVIASDGYEIEIEQHRIEDPDYPMILAYALNGVEVPSWEPGFRIAVLPEDGAVSNEEYGVSSAGSYWVSNVTKITLKAIAEK